MEEKQKRWLIVALVIACVGVAGLAVLGVIAGIAVPAWLSSARAANEAAVIATLNKIAAEEQTYYREHGSYASFDQLIEAGQLDKRFAGEFTTVAKGYIITQNVTPKGSSAPRAFSLNADPQQNEGFSATGKRHFYMNSADAAIHYNEEHPATDDDPVLGSEP
ncbi:MAG: hypothetical protein QOF61_530 [Acidobacteriota bacterium]|jgi:Tfp pilus assembly protein PilE|nr:hypothetical protein [Acidobacteriota bacterium]